MRPRWKFAGSYPLPWDVQIAGTFQNLPGPELLANYLVPNALIAPSLGRDLAAGSRSRKTVALIEPGTMYGERMTQVDMRMSKIIHVGRARIQANFDLYNLLNASPILATNSRFGSSWLRPTYVLPGRIFKVRRSGGLLIQRIPPGVCLKETPLACPDWGTPVEFRSQKFVKGKVPLGRDPALGALTPRITLSSKLNPGIRFPFREGISVSLAHDVLKEEVERVGCATRFARPSRWSWTKNCRRHWGLGTMNAPRRGAAIAMGPSSVG